MTNKAKFYKLALNLLKHNADIKFSYDHDKKKYEATELSFKYGRCLIELLVNQSPYLTWIKFENYNIDEFYFASFPEELDEVFDAIRVSNMKFLLEGIE